MAPALSSIHLLTPSAMLVENLNPLTSTHLAMQPMLCRLLLACPPPPPPPPRPPPPRPPPQKITTTAKRTWLLMLLKIFFVVWNGDKQ